MLSSAAKGGLSQTEITSWVFSIYVVGGLLSIILSFYYKQPIAVAFSIPGAIIVGTALANHSYTDVLGAYLITGFFIFLLGITGVVSVIMEKLPMSIMMGMVSGVLLPFGINIITAVNDDLIVNGPIFLTFLLLSFLSKRLRKIPPIIGAIVVAVVMYGLLRPISLEKLNFAVALPQSYLPSFQFGSIGEIVIPLLITVIAIQNAQGIGVLQSTGFNPPSSSNDKLEWDRFYY